MEKLFIQSLIQVNQFTWYIKWNYIDLYEAAIQMFNLY